MAHDVRYFWIRSCSNYGRVQISSTENSCRTHRRWNVKKANWDIYHTENYNRLSTENINTYDNFINGVNQSAEASIAIIKNSKYMQRGNLGGRMNGQIDITLSSSQYGSHFLVDNVFTTNLYHLKNQMTINMSALSNFVLIGLNNLAGSAKFNIHLANQESSTIISQQNPGVMENTTSLSTNDLYMMLMKAITQQGEDIKKHIDQENNKLRNLIEEQNTKIAILERKVEDVESGFIKLDRINRKNNIVIFGLEIGSRLNLAQTVLSKLNGLLDLNLQVTDLNNVQLIKTDKGCLVKVEFLSFLTKQLIFQHLNKLKGSKIYIANDLSYTDRINNRILVEHKKIANSKKIPAKIVGHRLLVNGELYTADQLNSESISFEEVQEQLLEEPRRSESEDLSLHISSQNHSEVFPNKNIQKSRTSPELANPPKKQKLIRTRSQSITKK
nr:unnamed protein product [Callosobruchus chinensis]